MEHIKALDGVRGIAVILVAAFHFGLAPFGWIGVQLFFVLSGYLITSILLSRRDSYLGSYLAQFYWRRTLRIFPLYFFFLALMGASWSIIGAPATWPADWPWLVTYLPNFARLRAEDLVFPFTHLWSLGIEEQFYLVWPFVIFFFSLRRLQTTVLALICLSPIIRGIIYAIAFNNIPDPAYAARAAYSLPFGQFDAFAIGATIPVLRLHEIKRPTIYFFAALLVTAMAGLGVLVYDYFTRGAFFLTLGYPHYMQEHFQYIWGYTLINVVSGFLILVALKPSILSPVLNNAALVRVGKISYGIYVYHFLVFGLVADVIQDFWLRFIVAAIVTYLVSECSYRYFESTFLRMKDRVFVRSANP